MTPGTPSHPVRIGLVADPEAPSVVADRVRDLQAPGEDDAAWDIDVVSEPFALDCEDAETAVRRLREHADERGWDVVVGITELPLRDREGTYLLVKRDHDGRAAVMSLPALGGVRVHRRTRSTLRGVLTDMIGRTSRDDARHVPLPGRGGRGRLLLGMVLANRPWLLVPGLKSALVAALATGAISIVNSTVWLLAGPMSWWRLVVATVASIALIVGWIVVDGELWDSPDDDSSHARERSVLYNTSTLLTLTLGVSICYVALFLVNLVWAWFVLDPGVLRSTVREPVGASDLVFLAWFVASAATVGGALGTGLESDEAIRAAAYSKREEERRARLADDRDRAPSPSA